MKWFLDFHERNQFIRFILITEVLIYKNVKTTNIVKRFTVFLWYEMLFYTIHRESVAYTDVYYGMIQTFNAVFEKLQQTVMFTCCYPTFLYFLIANLCSVCIILFQQLHKNLNYINLFVYTWNTCLKWH